MTDEVLEALVAIRDAKVALQTAERALGDKIRRDQKIFHEMVNAARESDEATTGSSHSGNDRSHSLCNVPLDHNPYLEALTHTVALDEEDVARIEACGE